jgi:hypothetical protein
MSIKYDELIVLMSIKYDELIVLMSIKHDELIVFSTQHQLKNLFFLFVPKTVEASNPNCRVQF